MTQVRADNPNRGLTVSRPAIVVGIVLSALLHTWLVWGDAPDATDDAGGGQQMATVPPELVGIEIPEPEPEPQPEPPPPPEPEPEQPPAEEAVPERREEQRGSLDGDEQADEPAPEAVPTPEPPPTPVPEPTPQSVAEAPAAAPEPAAQAQPREVTPPRQPPAPDRGRFGSRAGKAEVPPSPIYAIRWGTFEEAMRAVEAGGMRLAIVESGPGRDRVVVDDVVRTRDGRWTARPHTPPPIGQSFSKNSRGVGNVPSFAPIRDALAAAGLLGRGRELRVLLPAAVDRQMVSAALAAASRRRLTDAQVLAYLGRFEVSRGGVVTFRVDQVRPRDAT